MKTSMFILCALTFAMPVSKAEVVNVADHDIVPGKDVTLEVNRLIASLKGRSEVTLFSQKGSTTFTPKMPSKRIAP